MLFLCQYVNPSILYIHTSLLNDNIIYTFSVWIVIPFIMTLNPPGFDEKVPCFKNVSTEETKFATISIKCSFTSHSSLALLIFWKVNWTQFTFNMTSFLYLHIIEQFSVYNDSKLYCSSIVFLLPMRHLGFLSDKNSFF